MIDSQHSHAWKKDLGHLYAFIKVGFCLNNFFIHMAIPVSESKKINIHQTFQLIQTQLIESEQISFC